MNGYAKFIISLIATLGVALQAAVSDGKLTTAEKGQLLSLAVGSFLVWFVPNSDGKLPEVPPEPPVVKVE